MRIAIVMLLIGGVAQAQHTPEPIQWKSPTSVNQPVLITCWYNESGVYTGADSAQAGAHAGVLIRTGQGDYTWSYNILAPDGRSCPRTKPSLPRQQ